MLAGSIASIAAFFGYLSAGEFNLTCLGGAIMCAGGALLLIPACHAATKGTLAFSKMLFTKIKAGFIKKENK